MRSAKQDFRDLNINKANFDAIYHMPDPREYYRILCGLDYIIPDLARPVFQSMLTARAKTLDAGTTMKILDIGCSFGINETLLRYPLDIRRMMDRYTDPRMHRLSPEEIIAFDRHYFQSWPEQIWSDKTTVEYVGLDASQPAIDYALKTGLLHEGVVTNLEAGPPNATDAAALSNLSCIISTGCVGYVTEKTFEQVIALQQPGRMPWVVSFVLRMFPYDAVETMLGRHGLVTEKLEGVTFVQRRFHSEEEMQATMSMVSARGIETQGKEADGLYHAELFVSRPREAVEAMPLGEMVSVTSGASRRYGRRFRRITSRQIKLMS